MPRDSDLPLLPKPQRVALRGGSVRRQSFCSIALCGPAPRPLQKHVQEFARRNRLAPSSQASASIVVKLRPDESARCPEGCTLRIDDQIVVEASDAAGLFYGLQTLQQLFDAAEEIPRCRIDDWPALALRGLFFCLTRQVPTLDYLKLIVDRLAAVKMNLLMIQYREFFPYEGFPFIVSKGSYTPREIAEFVQYADERCIRVVPLLQSLSFQEHILRAQAYAHLRERPQAASGLCPTHPESFRLYRSLAEQLIAAHPDSRYFHLGADEATHVGQCERCKRAIARGSKASLVSGFTNRIIPFLLDSGVQPVMWADMLFGHLEDPASVSQYERDMFAELSRDVTAADWDYWSTGPKTPPARRSPYSGVAGLTHLDRLLKAGFRVIGAPSCSSCCNAKRNAIDHIQAFANITAFAKELRRRECLGMITTFWPTDAYPHVRWYDFFAGSGSKNETVDVCYNVVRPGLEAHWYSICRGAECAWSSTPRPKEDYDRAFARTFLGTNGTSYPDALNLASIPISGFGGRSPVSVARDVKRERLRRAVALMRRARRLAKQAQTTVDYSELFLRLQRHGLQWDEFHDSLPHINAQQLSVEQVRLLRKLVAERSSLEQEFRQKYLSIYKDVHLEEEVQLRFSEERRLQEQLLWEQKRRA